MVEFLQGKKQRSHYLFHLGAAYRSLAAVMDKKENLVKAINAYEEALKIYTSAKYPLYHKRVMANLDLTRQQMR